MMNQLMKQQSISMQILIVVLLNLCILKCYSLNSSCLSCPSTLYRSCYHCLNTLPMDRIYVEQISITCNATNNSIFEDKERFYSIIKSFSLTNCTMKTFYLDQYTLWNYLESISITYAHLIRLSPVIFNRSLSLSPILYSIKTLNLSHNALRILDANFSSYFPSLEKLDLSYNHLILVRKRTFIHLIHLRELYLNNNHLKQILSTIFPRQSLRLVNLNHNNWHCSCKSVLTLSISRPIPTCQTPTQYKSQRVDDIARQCFFRSKAIILVTTNTDKNQNLTCALSSTVDIWKNKINRSIILLSAWHVEQHHSINIEYLYALSSTFEKYLICFKLNSSQSEFIHTIIPLTPKLSLLNTTDQNIQHTMTLTTNRTVIVLESERKLPEFFLTLLNLSKKILPKSIRTSDQYVLYAWLIMLIIVILILSFLIFFVYRQRQKTVNYPYDSYLHSPHCPSKKPSNGRRAILNLKCRCRDHKCVCEYRRRAQSTLYLTESHSSKSIMLSSVDNNNTIQPLLIQPAELRYAKIKRISSVQPLDGNYSPGQFRTTVKLKTLPI